MHVGPQQHSPGLGACAPQAQLGPQFFHAQVGVGVVMVSMMLTDVVAKSLHSNFCEGRAVRR